VVLAMIEHGFTLQELSLLPFGVQTPLFEVLHKCRKSPPMSWPAAAYQLVGRPDLRVQHLPAEAVEAMKWSRPPRAPSSSPALDHDTPTLRFSNDARLVEASRALDSSVRVAVEVSGSEDMTDHDLLKEQQKQLVVLAARTLALPVGRAYLTLSSEKFPFLDGIYPIPPLVLDGTSGDRSQTQIVADPANFTGDQLYWPSFHNGVAAGLRLQQDQAGVSRRWILYNIPDLSNAQAASTHAGFLFGLGLTGLLKPLTLANLHDYFLQGNELIHIGLLLGTAATYRATQNAAINRLISIHVPALRPPSSSPVDVAPSVQIASLISIGLLFQGSGHRQMIEILLRQIRLPPSDDPAFMRESYGLSAGIGLGFVTLGLGGKLLGVSDLQLEESLLEAVDGKQCAGPQKSLLVQQGTLAVGDVVVPGSVLALGLMYLRTNNQAIARRLGLSALSQNALKVAKPDYLLLRTWAANLILWDSIEASDEFFDKHSPPAGESFASAAMHITAGCSLTLACKYAGSHNQSAATLLLAKLRGFLGADLGPSGEKCLDTVALSLACVLAGSGNREVLDILLSLHRRTSPQSYGSHLAINMAIGLLFLGAGDLSLSNNNESVAVLIAALYPKFPLTARDNRYHLQAYRHLIALATERRTFVVRDCETGMPCYLPLEINLCHPADPDTIVDTLRTTAPCVLPAFDTLHSIRTASPRYWAQTLLLREPQHAALVTRHLAMFVKRKAGFLSYAEDPGGTRTILARAFPKFSELSTPERREQNLEDFVSSFVDDPNLKAFVRHFCEMESDQQASAFFTAVLYECLTREKSEVLSVYLRIWAMTRTPHPAPLDLANLALIRAYYQAHSAPEPLLQSLFLQDTIRFVNRAFSPSKDSVTDAIRRLLAGTAPTEPLLLAQLLQHYQLPGPAGRQSLQPPALPEMSCRVRAALLLPWLRSKLPAAPTEALLFLSHFY
jgi:anaphase-promoting complex subunit 1